VRATGTTETDLVVAARGGDARAIDELVTSYLPLVYNVVGRALGTPDDVDDVVQDTMLRALRELPALRAPESFRAWLLTIAIHQVGTHRRRHGSVAARTAALDEVTDVRAGGDFEDLAILRLGLAGQRRQAALAGRWLDPDNRTLLSLWWLEAAGQVSRSDLAAAVGLTDAHAGVRVQRMRDQFDVSRSVVAALEANPRCAGLDAMLTGWDGSPGPLWRKRIGRHVRSCAECGGHVTDLVPAEALLLALALVPVPVALTVALASKGALASASAGGASAGGASAGGASAGGASAGGASAGGASAGGASASAGAGAGVGGKAGLVGQAAHAVLSHPLLVVAITAGLVAGTVAVTGGGPERRPAAQAAAGAAVRPVPAIQDPGGGSTAPVPPLPVGRVSLESANAPGRYVAHAGDVTALTPIGIGSPGPDRTSATFEAAAGLAGTGCVSFRAADGRYLRHSSWRLRADSADGTALFRGDATFCPRRGSIPGTTAWESQNYPGWFLRHVGDELWVDRSDGSADFEADSAFHVRAPLAG
jgi:RNA polymerase sigma factor (sigma-70 family)